MVAVVDVPVGAMKKLDDIADIRLATEGEHEPIVRGMRDEERVCVKIRFEHDAITVVIQDEAVVLGDEAECSGVSLVRTHIRCRVSG